MCNCLFRMIVSKWHWPCSETHEAFAPQSHSREHGRVIREPRVRCAGSRGRSSATPLRGFFHMIMKFKVGDHVRWNSEAGYVSGTIIKVHTRNVDYKGYVHHASADDPQYEIQSDKSEHVAIHKGSALRTLN